MIQTCVRRLIPAPPERVFDVAVAVATLPATFVGFGPVPAIREAWIDGGGVTRAGAIRYVRNSDGSVIEERITALERPQRQAYELVAGFKPPIAWLVARASGEWIFRPVAGGTAVQWRFRFQPRHRLGAPLLAALAWLFFRPAQRRCLHRLAARVERG